MSKHTDTLKQTNNKKVSIRNPHQITRNINTFWFFVSLQVNYFLTAELSLKIDCKKRTVIKCASGQRLFNFYLENLYKKEALLYGVWLNDLFFHYLNVACASFLLLCITEKLLIEISPKFDDNLDVYTIDLWLEIII